MEEMFRLNPIQRKFWLDHLLKYPTAEYNDTNHVFKVSGNLDVARLKEACRLIMLEYFPLHSTIQVENGIPFFVPSEDVEVPFYFADCSYIASEEGIMEKLEGWVCRPFDLQKEFPCRFYVVRQNGRYFLLFLFHHIVMEGTTLILFFKRLSAVYHELSVNAYVPVDQTDMIHSFNMRLEAKYAHSHEDDVAYWRDYIRGVPLTYPIYKESTSLKVEGEQDFRLVFRLGEGLYAESHRFCEKRRTTPFRLYSTAWALTLSRIGSADGLLLDHALDLHPKEDSALFGVFINNLPIKYDFRNGEMAFSELLSYANVSRQQEKKHLCASYGDFLFRTGDSGSEREMVNVGINYPLKINTLALELDGCVTENFRHINVVPSMDLVLSIEDDDDFTCDIRYNPAVSRNFVQTLAEAYREILAQAIADPDIKLKDLRLLSKDKQDRLLSCEEESLHKADRPDSILSRFKRFSISDHAAVTSGSRTVSYAELDKLSDKVARSLCGLHIVHKHIGLASPKNIEMLVGILGIMKSGNAYVPIDCDFPEGRIAFIVEDCQIDTILATRETPLRNISHKQIHFIEDLLSYEETAVSLPEILPSDAAYVIYTSGTTGRPKGIPIRHSMLNQTVVNNIGILRLDEHSRVSQLANISFDASVLEIFTALAAGATLVLPQDSVRKDPVLLLSFLESQKITAASIPPAMLSVLPHALLPDLSAIIVGGDSVSHATVERWSEGRRFINSYGPAENCVDATYAVLSADSPANDIGCSVPGVACYVLDKSMQLMPDYAIGELYVGGVKLTEGYLNRPELNAERFVTNPFMTDAERERGVAPHLYKTGDLVYRDENGHLFFIGRSDFQVKLNGYRIELGEIESKLREFGSYVQNAAVIVQEQEGRKRLVAYVQTQAAGSFPVDELKAFLRGQLPGYMIPPLVVPLEELPYNSSGKVDRKLLPAPAFVKEERNVRPPITPVEQRLAALWSDLLTGAVIGRDDSFTSLGGDSMAVIHLSFRIKELFGYPIKASEIYEHITLKELAGFLEEHADTVHEAAGYEEYGDSKEKVGLLPLPPAQLSLWMECMKSEELKNTYNLPCIFELPMTVRASEVEAALNRLVQIQDAFRMSFPIDNEGKPYIRIGDFQRLKIEEEDISGTDLRERLNRDMSVSFDLEHGPLFRCVLYRVDNGKRVCSLVMHHLISDGWSAQLIRKYFLQTASGAVVGQDEFSGSYVNYAQEMSGFVHSTAYSHRLEYWKECLQGTVELGFPHRKQAGKKETDGNVCRCPLPQDLADRISRFCHDRSCTPFQFYISVYLLVLSRVFKQTDFAVGFPFLGREHERRQHTVGYFVHTLPLLYRKDYGRLSFAQYLKALSGQLVLAGENAVSLDRLTEVVHSLTGNADMSLVKTLFAFERKEMFHDYLRREDFPFDLSLTILSDTRQQVSCSVEYRYSCFSEADIERLVSAYLAVLDAAVSDPERTVTAYSLASMDYQRQVIASNSLSAALGKEPASFLEHFAAMVKAYPQRTALIDEGKSVTYEELDKRSDRIRSVIQEAGVVSPASIAVNMIASVDSVVAMIGVLKSGCCYVPIAVDFPPERRDFILRDAFCQMIFNEVNFPYGSVLKKNPVEDEIRDQLKGCAYIIYTSGTTGQPKGVPISSRSMAYLIQSMIGCLKLNADSRTLLFANISFDISVCDIFSTLSVGATVVIASQEERKDPNLLADLLERQAVTYAEIAPAMLPLLPKREFPALATLSVGGEPTPLSALEYWHKNRMLLNVYGPTETTVYVTGCKVDDSFEPNDIGMPFQGVSCYVLDEHLNILPPDMIGELYIGGVQLTQGYLNRPDLTEEKFVDNPFVTEEDKAEGLNARLYKSGDLVKRRADGHLIFVGRADHQVKLHGYRIELGDIESKIMQFEENVKNAAVLLQEKAGDPYLAAYIQANSAQDFPLDALKSFLRKQLPTYMIPSAFAVLEQFPHNSNGKTDRKQLQKLEAQVAGREVEPPHTETECRLASLWTALLPVRTIGRSDSLTSLGGDSMAVIQLSFRIHEEFGFRIKVADIYRHPVLSDLAGFIDRHSDTAAQETSGEDMPEAAAEGPVPLSPTQFSLWLQCVQSAEMKDAYVVPCMFECLPGTDPAVLEDALNRLTEVQDAFRISFPVDGSGKPFIRVAGWRPFRLEVWDIAGEELGERLNQDIRVSFDLEQGPLFRCALYRVDGRRYVCSLVMHHLISDGWSVRLIRELLLQAVSGQAPDWERAGGSYVRYALEANRSVMTGAYSRRLEYWRRYLDGAVELGFPSRGAGGAEDISGERYCFSVPAELSDRILAFCRQQACSPFIFYCAVYMLLLSRMSGQTGFTIGIPYFGREREAYSRVIGYFVHTLPLRYKEETVRSSFVRYVLDLQNDMAANEDNSVPLNRVSEVIRSAQADPVPQLVRTLFAMEEKNSLYDGLSMGKADFDLLLLIQPDGAGRYSGVFDYRISCFAAGEIERLATAYLSLLGNIVADGNKMPDAYPLASPDYCRSVVLSNSLSLRQGVPSVPFLERFSLAVRENSQHIAVICRNNQISYQALDRLSDEVAASIRSAGILPPACVAVCMQGSIACIASIIGILKSGCCYVPVDTELPDERRDFILKDTSCPMFFDNANFPHGSLIGEAVQSGRKKEYEHCAYVIYTSGTTGNPKGALISHSSLAHLIAVESVEFGLSEESRCLLFSSISFDASVLQIFPALSAGATLIVAGQECRRDPLMLADLLASGEVTFAAFPPALLELLPSQDFPALKTLVIGGESASRPVIGKWSRGRTLINAYGPTENTVDTTMCVVDGTSESNDIGTPLPGVSCYVLDERLNIVPPGMTGELYIGGVRLTGGYLNRPDLNREKFVDNPYVTSEDKARGINTRLYRSGDLVRCRPDGHLIFMGRADTQVKLRGFRIELSEIETVLQSLPHVRNALIEVRNGGELAAFVQTDGRPADIAELQRILRGKLPPYMVPSKWAVVDEFPLTTNGKIDRRRLPEPDIAVGAAGVVPAATEGERLLLAEARAVMGTEAVGVETDLPDAGMTSMQVMEFVARVVAGTSLRLTASSVYRDRTIRRLLRAGEEGLSWWWNAEDGEKPVLVFMAGFPDISPFYDSLLHYLARDFSVFVFESCYAFLAKKEQVLLDDLMCSYEAALSEALQGRPVEILTGYCMGAELAVAFAGYMHARHPDRAPYRLLNMEGIYGRVGGTDVSSVPEEALADRIRVTDRLYENFPEMDGYKGDIIHVMAGHCSNVIYPEAGEEIDEDVVRRIRESWEANRRAWRAHYPSAPYYELDCDHWTFFEESNLKALREIIRKHWHI